MECTYSTLCDHPWLRRGNYVMFAGVCVVMLQGDRSSDTIGAGKGFCTGSYECRAIDYYASGRMGNFVFYGAQMTFGFSI